MNALKFRSVSTVRIAGGDSMFIKHPGGWRLRLSGGALLVALTGCSGGNDSMNTDSMASSPPAASSPPSMMLTADFDSIQANIFTPICAGCHGGANPAENLNLDAEHSYNDLINVPSTEEPTLDRVKPGDPTNSYLVSTCRKKGTAHRPATSRLSSNGFRMARCPA